MLEIEKKQINAVTKSPKIRLDEKPSYPIGEQNGTIMNKRSYDLIFHLVPLENDVLKNKLMDKFAITKLTNEFRLVNTCHYIRLISNQFSNTKNYNSTQDCIRNILKLSESKSAENIAINVDFDNIRHYLFFKKSYQEIFANKTITSTFYLNKIVALIEREDIETILKLYHMDLLGGHLSSSKMKETIGKFYTWENMMEDIKTFVKKCSTCEKTKYTTNTKVPMQISSLGEVLFDHTYIDFVGPIKTTEAGHKFIFTATCDLTKFLIAVPTVDSTALTAANCILENIICRYNFPSRLISDNAQSFVSLIIKELTRLFSIKKIFSTPYHPQSNIVERTHRSLNAYLRAFTEKNKNTWDELLKFATFVYNNSVHSTTGYTPHELAHGFKIQIQTHFSKPKSSYNYDNLADLTRNTIAKTLEIAREHLHNRKIQNKRQYDANTKELDIKINDLILIRSPKKKHKFQEAYEGPYRVLDVSECYVEIIRKGKKLKIHKNWIKKASAEYENEPPQVTPIILE